MFFIPFFRSLAFKLAFLQHLRLRMSKLILLKPCNTHRLTFPSLTS